MSCKNPTLSMFAVFGKASEKALCGEYYSHIKYQKKGIDKCRCPVRGPD